MGAALRRFWNVRVYISEGIGWMERVLAEGEPAASPARVKALEGLGWLLQFQGESERAEVIYKEMLELSRELGDEGNVATALNSLGTVAAYKGDSARARALSEEALALAHELGRAGVEFIPAAFVNLGLAALGQGEHERAMESFEEALRVSQNLGQSRSLSMPWRGWLASPRPWRLAFEQHTCGEPRRRRASLPASPCHPASGHCTSPIWLQAVRGLGKRHGRKR
jgi:tetratricopeptide (TPR) repeat protein